MTSHCLMGWGLHAKLYDNRRIGKIIHSGHLEIVEDEPAEIFILPNLLPDRPDNIHHLIDVLFIRDTDIEERLRKLFRVSDDRLHLSVGDDNNLSLEITQCSNP